MFGGVDAWAVVGSDDAMDGGVVFEGAELFEAFGDFEWAGWPLDELVEEGAAVAVDAHVTPEGEVGDVGARVWDGAAAEVEGAAGAAEDALYDVRVFEEGGVVERVDGGDHAGGWVAVAEEAGDVVDEGWVDERFVALDIDDVEVVGEGVGGFGDAVGAALVVWGSHDDFCAEG